MTRLLGAATAIAAVLSSSPVYAQSEREAIQGQVKNGQKVSITDSHGMEINGTIDAITADGLSLRTHGKSTDVPYEQIIRIDRPHDGLGNGALIGLAVGAAVGVVGVAIDDHQTCGVGDVLCSETTAGTYAAGALLAGGLGAAVGVAIDALIHHDRQIYRRGGHARVIVSPSLREGSRAGVVSLSW
jgi:hypothetical protein